MARPLRIEFEGALYHVTSRGNARESIFFTDSDRETFLKTLAEAVDRYSWICHAYCLMTNHYHMLVETPDAKLSRGMRHLNGVYTQRTNRKHRRCGHLLQGRFKSILVEKESHLLELARYVVLNPVRAKMARTAKDWPWSSYRATAGMGEAPPWLTTDWLLAQFDRDRSKAQHAYRKFVRQGRGVEIWDELRPGQLLGPDAFADRMAPLLGQHHSVVEFPRTQRLAARPSLEALFSEIPDKTARNLAIHEARYAHEYTLKELSEFLGLHYSTISVITKRVHEQLEDKK